MAFTIAVLLHLALLSVTWVGFPVAMPRERVDFFYGDTFLSGEEPALSGDAQRQVIRPVIKTEEGAFYPPWLRLRDLNKPK